MTSAAGTQVDAMHVVVMRAAKGDHAAFTTSSMRTTRT